MLQYIPTLTETLITVFIFLVTYRVYQVWQALKNVDYLPGMRPLFSPLGAFGALLPTTWWNPGLGWHWKWRQTGYFNRTHEVISAVPLLSGYSLIYISSLNVLKQIFEHERKYGLDKPRYMSEGILLWGNNLLAANVHSWKRQRKVVSPAISNKTYELVVRETLDVCREMQAQEGWGDKQEFVVNDINHITRKLALVVIARCAFNFPTKWTDIDSEEVTAGRALQTVSTTVILRLAVPRWMYKLPIKSLRRMDIMYPWLADYMERAIAERQEIVNNTEPDHLDGDLFTRLVSSLDEDGQDGLTKEEVIGNTFAFMFAGHETTAKSLAALFGFLSIHQDEQDKAVAEMNNILEGGRDVTYEDFSRFKHLLACIYETLRIFPAGFLIIREVPQDMFVHVTRPKEQMICIKKGSCIVGDMVAVHHDPYTFHDPESWIPSRWYDVPEHAISMFGVGPRSCIGKKFSLVETVTFLVAMLRDWKLEPVLKEGESLKEYEERIMAQDPKDLPAVSLGVGPVSVKLVRRSH
ncbi:cytochrome P450 family protein [Abortiporus biennis]